MCMAACERRFPLLQRARRISARQEVKGREKIGLVYSFTHSLISPPDSLSPSHLISSSRSLSRSMFIPLTTLPFFLTPSSIRPRAVLAAFFLLSPPLAAMGVVVDFLALAPALFPPLPPGLRAASSSLLYMLAHSPVLSSQYYTSVIVLVGELCYLLFIIFVYYLYIFL
eukprot:GHVU01005297.1.p1 GENE.GHVU01005297.1~~GHVU01005297.1.p1  ORF type:complete len:169 (-),score=8.28 GHVU01005297.1:440-946(-)